MSYSSAKFPVRILAVALAGLLHSMASAQTQQAPLYSAVAEEEQQETLPRYRVEMIVFAYSEDASGSGEMWIPDEPPPETAVFEPPIESAIVTDEALDSEVLEQQRLEAEVREFEEFEQLLQDDDLVAIELALDVAEDKESTRILFPGELVLGATFAKLERLDTYLPLLHAGWIQTVYEQEDMAAVPLDAFGELPRGLDGSVTLYMGRFLHLVMNLELDADWQIPLDDSASTLPDEEIVEYSDNRVGTGLLEGNPMDAAEPSIRYRIIEDRKVRRNELHYFDHPKFGVIARVTLEELEQSTDDQEADEFSPDGGE